MGCPSHCKETNERRIDRKLESGQTKRANEVGDGEDEASMKTINRLGTRAFNEARDVAIRHGTAALTRLSKAPI
jgi:hypothetical protein